MKFKFHFIKISVCILAICLICVSCEKEKPKGKVIVTETEFMIRQDTDHSFVVDAKGKIKNIGTVDVKKVEVTGNCKSCGEVLVNGKWFITDYEKTPDQKDMISYLAVDSEEEFSFRGVAFLMEQGGNRPEALPEKLEVEVLSFEVIEK